MELKNRKGFVHTLEAVIAASLLITTATVVIPQIQPDKSVKDYTQENIFQGLQTLDKTGELRNDLSTSGLKEEITVLNPNEFNLTVLVADTNTETVKLEVEETLWRYIDRVGVSEQEDWQGEFNQTSVDRADNSGNLGIGYRNGTLDDSLVGFWRLDRISGPAVDYSGNNNDGEVYGSDRAQKGVFSTNSYYFSTESDRVNISDTQELSGGPDAVITVAFWFKLDNTHDTDDVMVDKNKGSNNGDWGLGTESDTGELAYYSENDGGDYELEAGNLENNTWHHAAFVLDQPNDNLYLYLDGQQIASDTNTGLISADTDNNVYIGGRYYLDGDIPDRQCQCNVDEVRIYNRTLSENEIEGLYFNGRNGEFEGNYTDSHEIPYNALPEKIEIDSEGVNSGNISWVKVDTSEGESDEFKIDSGSSERNYTLDFSKPASELDITFNFSVDNSTPVNTPVINDFKLWTNDSSDRSIEFEKEGDSVKSQIFVDSSNGLNISYGPGLIAENITESRYIFQQTENDGTLKFYGDANLTVDITNKTIKGDPADQDDVKNVNYPIYQNGSKEVTVSTWN